MVTEEFRRMEELLKEKVPSLGSNILKKTILDLGVILEVATERDLRNVAMEVCKRVEHFFGKDLSESLMKDIKKQIL